METITDRLFLTISGLIGIRMTKDNFKNKLKRLQTDGTYNQKMKNEILTELVMVVVELDEQIQELKNAKK